jgi:acetylornithine deacetylase
MRTQKMNNKPQIDGHWNNKYTLFSESVTLLQKLIATPSFSGEESAAADVVAGYLDSIDIPVKRHLNNVWAFNKFFDPQYPTILLNSHLDTVRPNDGYSRDPYFPEITDGKLYGLGSNDAGGCLISLMAAFMNFYHQQHLGFNLCFAATAEEENSGENGIKAILPLIGKIDFAIVGEPTLLQMAIAEKGNMVLDCICEGRAGHAAREEGDNAIFKCLRDLEWFKNLTRISKIGNNLLLMIVSLV